MWYGRSERAKRMVLWYKTWLRSNVLIRLGAAHVNDDDDADDDDYDDDDDDDGDDDDDDDDDDNNNDDDDDGVGISILLNACCFLN